MDIRQFVENNKEKVSEAIAETKVLDKEIIELFKQELKNNPDKLKDLVIKNPEVLNYVDNMVVVKPYIRQIKKPVTPPPNVTIDDKGYVKDELGNIKGWVKPKPKEEIVVTPITPPIPITPMPIFDDKPKEEIVGFGDDFGDDYKPYKAKTIYDDEYKVGTIQTIQTPTQKTQQATTYNQYQKPKNKFLRFLKGLIRLLFNRTFIYFIIMCGGFYGIYKICNWLFSGVYPVWKFLGQEIFPIDFLPMALYIGVPLLIFAVYKFFNN